MHRFRYIKAIDEATYQRNIGSIDTDFKAAVLVKNIGKLGVFTDDGKLHQIKVKDIPLSKYKDKGVPLENISNCTGAEEIVLLEAMETVVTKQYFFATSQGMVKRVNGLEFEAGKKTIDATKLTKDGKLIKTPDWMINYRHPDYEAINRIRR